MQISNGVKNYGRCDNSVKADALNSQPSFGRFHERKIPGNRME